MRLRLPTPTLAGRAARRAAGWARRRPLAGWVAAGVLLCACAALSWDRWRPFGRGRGDDVDPGLGNPPGAVDRLVVLDSAAHWAAGRFDGAEAATAPAGGFRLSGKEGEEYPRRGRWTSAVVPADFPFTELIPSYNAHVPPGTGLRLEVRVRQADSGRKSDGGWSPWLYLGAWGRTVAADPRVTRYAGGRVYTDYVALRKPADAVQLRVELLSFSPDPRVAPMVRRVAAVYTGVVADPAARARLSPPVVLAGTWALDLGVPFRCQRDAPKPMAGQICSPTSTSMVAEYWGAWAADRPTADAAAAVYDAEYDLFGNWGRAVQWAAEQGLDGWVTRFRGWDAVKAEVERGRPIVASVRYDKGTFPSAVLDETDGHLIVIRGFTPAGDVIVNDPANKRRGNGAVYRADELARAWFGHGGVAYVLRGPAGPAPSTAPSTRPAMSATTVPATAPAAPATPDDPAGPSTRPATAPVPAGGSRVTIDADGVLAVDGSKVFPIGLTLPPPPDGKAPNGKDAFAELHAAGVTFIRTGPTGPGRWDDAQIAEEQQYEDAAARSGLRCMVWLKELAALDEAAAGTAKEARLRKVVGRFRDHPGFGLWKGADEPQWGKVPVGAVVRAYGVVKEVDPDHPVWIVQAPRGTVETLRPYDLAYDIVGADVYPIGYPPGTHSLLPNKEISMVGDYTRTMRQVAGRKPVWMTLQIAWSGVTNPGKTLRFPTFPQERYMAYQAIANGARGLVFFGGHIKAAWNPADEKLGWNWTFWGRVLRPVVEEMGPESRLAPALVAPDSPLPIRAAVLHGNKGTDVAPAGDGAGAIEFCAREAGGDLYLLACKREGDTVRVRFTGLPPSAGEGEVLFESPRRVRAAVEGERPSASGAFTDWFAPFDVHVYRFHLRP